MGQHSDIEHATQALRAKASKALRSGTFENVAPESKRARSAKRGEPLRKDLKRDDYEKILRKLHVKLVELQDLHRL
jgi:hypothetical protein